MAHSTATPAPSQGWLHDLDAFSSQVRRAQLLTEQACECFTDLQAELDKFREHYAAGNDETAQYHYLRAQAGHFRLQATLTRLEEMREKAETAVAALPAHVALGERDEKPRAHLRRV